MAEKRSSTMELRSMSKRQKSMQSAPAVSTPRRSTRSSHSRTSIDSPPAVSPSKRTMSTRPRALFDPPPATTSSRKPTTTRSKRASGTSGQRSAGHHATSLNTVPRAVPFLPPPSPIANRARSESAALIHRGSVAPDTPYKQSTASLVSTTDQVYHTTSAVKASKTLSTTADEGTLEHNAKIRGKPMTREEMEKLLRAEIHGAVYLSHDFCSEQLAISDKARLRHLIQQLEQDPFFQYVDPEAEEEKKEGLSIDLGGFGQNESGMYATIVKLLNTINEVAFTRNHFRPKLRPIVDEHARKMWADDIHDSETSPDLVQADPADHEENSNFHWMDVEFFCECKRRPSQLGEALLQLARYARATYSHQLYRDHIYSLAICGEEATFVLFDRAKITHSAPINLRTDLVKFVEAAIGLFSLDAKEFGYDTRFSWSPAPTGEPGDREIVRELRFYHNDADWQVLEVLCQRKCLLGRATTVLRVGKVHDPSECCATKMIWRPVSRPHEADSLFEFAGNEGVVQCLWSDKGRLTTLEHLALADSPFQKYFFPGLSDAEYLAICEKMSEPGQSKASDILKQGASEARRKRPYRLEERQKDVVQMLEGTTLWRIQRFVHLLIVLRDAIVGYAHVVKKGKIHRDVSLGNVLCDILKDPKKPKKTGPAINLRSRRCRAQIQEDDYQFMATYEFPIEEELTGVESLEDYVEKRYGSETNPQMSIGRLSDFEFAVDAFRPEDVVRGAQRTGTLTFMSARLLLLHEEPVPIPHTYLNDLESFFWVFFWVIVNHSEPGQHRNGKARNLAASLSTSDIEKLGNKKVVILRGGSREDVQFLDNVWSMDAMYPIGEFADILDNQMYAPDAKRKYRETFTSPDESTRPDPWIVLKAVIDVFDRHIMRLQRRDQQGK